MESSRLASIHIVIQKDIHRGVASLHLVVLKRSLKALILALLG